MRTELHGLDNAPGIYKIVNQITGKVYIGQTHDFAKRAKKHESYLKRNKHHNNHLQHSWNQHGSDEFVFSVLAVIDCPEKRTVVEQRLIDMFYGKSCYNLLKKAYFVSEETKEKQSSTQCGKKRAAFSAEHKAKIGAAHKGKNVSEETRKKISAARLGKRHSEERKEEMRKYKHSEETKQKMREAASKRNQLKKGGV